MKNEGSRQRLVLSPLSDSQLDEALKAFDQLGATYTLTEAVKYFLSSHRPPEFTIRLKDSIKLYLDDRERDGLRNRSLKGIKSVIEQFLNATTNPWTHEITSTDINKFLVGLRAKDGRERASKKTWNNYRNDLNSQFEWCRVVDVHSNRPFCSTIPLQGFESSPASGPEK